MIPLFETGPVYDPHVTSIIKFMLSKLKNNKPKTDSKVYVRNANFIKEIYEGKFLRHSFNTERKDYDYNNSFDKIRNCKNNWQNTRDIIVSSIENIELAKSKDYLPFNKSFVNSISFATFFEFFDINAINLGMNSNFLNFINPPNKCYTYTSNLTIEKLKKNCLSNILSSGEKIVKKYFRDKKQELSFWYNMEDFSRWLKKFKSSFSTIYNEFIINCENGNPLDDYMNYLTVYLNWKQGDNIIMQSVYFQLSRVGSERLEYNFLNWLRNGIEKGKFAALKRLPKSIENYYTDNSFEKVESKKTEKKKKEIVEIDDLPIF